MGRWNFLVLVCAACSSRALPIPLDVAPANNLARDGGAADGAVHTDGAFHDVDASDADAAPTMSPSVSPSASPSPSPSPSPLPLPVESCAGGLTPLATERGFTDPFAVTTGDFDHDGHRDFAAVSERLNDVQPHELWVWHGNGAGGFAPPLRTLLDDRAPSAAAADFDGDGQDDVALLTQHGGIEVYSNGVQTRTDLPLDRAAGDSDSYHSQLLAGDVDADGHPDLVAASSSDVWLVRGLGGGAFAEPIKTPMATPPFRLALGDFDEDGRLDLVSSQNGFQFLHGAADGTFTAPAGQPDHSADWETQSLSAADLDGDGHLDVFLASAHMNCQSCVDVSYILYGHGDGTFDAIHLDGTRSYAGTAADLDGDGVPEIIEAADAVTIVRRTGPRAWTADPALAAIVPFPRGGGAPWTAVATGDFDEDGGADLLSFDFGTSEVRLFPGHAPASSRPASQPLCAGSPLSGDFDHDGRLDVVTLCGDAVELRRGLGGGALGTAERFAVPPWTTALYPGDFNEDGWMDVAVGPWLLLWDPAAGGFGAPVAVGAAPIYLLDVADLDGDGHLDLLTNDYDWPPNHVTFERGLGNGRFAPPLALTWSWGDTFGVRDTNGDGVADDATIPELPQRDGFDAYLWGDLDGDGRLDTVQTEEGHAQVWLASNHQVQLDSPDCPTWFGHSGAVVADLDGDGRADLAVATSQGIAWCRGTGDGHFVAVPGVVAPYLSPDVLRAVDLDGDGHPDLIAAESEGGTLSVIRNDLCR